jgi:hypothetical protein
MILMDVAERWAKARSLWVTPEVNMGLLGTTNKTKLKFGKTDQSSITRGSHNRP